MKNRSRVKDHTVTVTLRVDTVLYTGRLKDAVKKEKVERLVKTGAGRYSVVVAYINICEFRFLLKVSCLSLDFVWKDKGQSLGIVVQSF
jgi:hypothetical protein